MKNFVEIEENDDEQYVAFLIPEFAHVVENSFGETIFQWRDEEGFHRCAMQVASDNPLTGAFFEHSLTDRVVTDESTYPSESSLVEEEDVSLDDVLSELVDVSGIRPELVPVLMDFVELLRRKSDED